VSRHACGEILPIPSEPHQVVDEGPAHGVATFVEPFLGPVLAGRSTFGDHVGTFDAPKPSER